MTSTYPQDLHNIKQRSRLRSVNCSGSRKCHYCGKQTKQDKRFSGKTIVVYRTYCSISCKSATFKKRPKKFYCKICKKELKGGMIKKGKIQRSRIYRRSKLGRKHVAAQKYCSKCLVKHNRESSRDKGRKRKSRWEKYDRDRGIKKRFYYDLETHVTLMREGGVRSSLEWKEICRMGWLPDGIYSRPDQKFQDPFTGCKHSRQGNHLLNKDGKRIASRISAVTGKLVKLEGVK